MLKYLDRSGPYFLNEKNAVVVVHLFDLSSVIGTVVPTSLLLVGQTQWKVNVSTEEGRPGEEMCWREGSRSQTACYTLLRKKGRGGSVNMK